MSELFIMTPFLDEEFYLEPALKQETEKHLGKQIPVGATVQQITWRPLLHLDGTDTQWQAVLIYELGKIE
jgi:hypothetical protein